MRTYPANSPQVAARIVALTAVVDGDIGDAETEWLGRPAAPRLTDSLIARVTGPDVALAAPSDSHRVCSAAGI